MCVRLCVMELGSLGGRTTAVMLDLRIYNTFCTACVVDALEEQHLKRTQSGNSSWSGYRRGAGAEAAAIGAQFGLTMQGSYSAHRRHYCTRLLVCQSTEGATIYNSEAGTAHVQDMHIIIVICI